MNSRQDAYGMNASLGKRRSYGRDPGATRAWRPAEVALQMLLKFVVFPQRLKSVRSAMETTVLELDIL